MQMNPIEKLDERHEDMLLAAKIKGRSIKKFLSEGCEINYFGRVSAYIHSLTFLFFLYFTLYNML